MDHHITIEYPETLALSLKMQNLEFEREIKTLSLVKLYELGKISSGIAAKTLGITRVDFLDILASYKVSVFANTSELGSDFANA
jgi:predicted HTH domain antitoxin